MTEFLPSNIDVDDMFRPPINRAMRVLDRSFFQKKIPTLAALILNPKNTSKFKTELYNDTLKLDRMQAIKVLHDAKGQKKKGIMLKPNIKKDDASTWSPKLAEAIQASQVDLVPYDLDLDYNYWTYHDVMSSILPMDEQEEIPQGFSVVGHIAHLNLRDLYLPYKHLIATVLMDKSPNIRTVINKIDVVGAENVYRTFNYELLAGTPDMKVETSEENCTFCFDYSKVYWNSRLNTEHRRIVESLKPGEAICDVMAGVGPFAVPAGKRNCFVYANDLNPDSFASLEDAIGRNKASLQTSSRPPFIEALIFFEQVHKYVRPHNEDGLTFIKSSTEDLFNTDYFVEITPIQRHSRHKSPPPPAERKFLHQPKTFSHYILNLPASAVTFLPAFIGLYANRSNYFVRNPSVKLPVIHVYCFSTKSEDNKKEEAEICEEISRQLGREMKPGDPEKEGEVKIWDVRDVAPLKRMFCATFRLPGEVAFAGA